MACDTLVCQLRLHRRSLLSALEKLFEDFLIGMERELKINVLETGRTTIIGQIVEGAYEKAMAENGTVIITP